jgi:hypothetical protein
MTPRTRKRLQAAITAALQEADTTTVRSACIEALGQKQPGKPRSIPDALVDRAIKHIAGGGTLCSFATEAKVPESTLRAAIKRSKQA